MTYFHGTGKIQGYCELLQSRVPLEGECDSPHMEDFRLFSNLYAAVSRGEKIDWRKMRPLGKRLSYRVGSWPGSRMSSKPAVLESMANCVVEQVSNVERWRMFPELFKLASAMQVCKELGLNADYDMLDMVCTAMLGIAPPYTCKEGSTARSFADHINQGLPPISGVAAVMYVNTCWQISETASPSTLGGFTEYLSWARGDGSEILKREGVDV